MKLFFGVFQREYSMSIKRWSLWLAFGVLIVLHLSSILMPPDTFERVPGDRNVLSYAGTYAFLLNLFMPVVGGILIADRLVRDRKLGVDELLYSTALKRWQYLLGKFFGALFSIMTPVVLTSLIVSGQALIHGAPISILPAELAALLGVNLPAYVLVTAFSLACPLVMPVRVYQVLFTGYWFWGNYLSPNVLPTLNGTLLCANGEYVLTAFLGGFYGLGGPDTAPAQNPAAAIANVAALCACAGLALFAADRYLARQAARS